MAQERIYTVERTKVGAYRTERGGRRGVAIAFADERGREWRFALTDSLALKLHADLNRAARELGVLL